MEEVEALVPDGDGVDGGARVDGEEAGGDRGEAELEVVPDVEEEKAPSRRETGLLHDLTILGGSVGGA